MPPVPVEARLPLSRSVDVPPVVEEPVPPVVPEVLVLKFVSVLARHDLVGSTGRVGAAGDNAAMESFFALLRKNVLDRRTWATRQELRIAIVTWDRAYLPPTPEAETPGPIDPRRVRDHRDPTRSLGCINPAVTRSCSSPWPG